MELQITKVLDLQAYYSQIQDKKLPIKTIYKFSKLFSALSGDTDFYYKKLKEIVSTYAEKDDQGNPVSANNGFGVKIREDSLEQCQKELNELISLKVSAPDIKFTLDELDCLELTVEQFNMFLPFVEE